MAMANRCKDERFQADMTTFSSNAQARINDLKKNGKSKDSRMDKFQAQPTKIDVRTLSNEKRTQKIPKQLGPQPSHKTMGTDTDDGALRRNILRTSQSGICLWDIMAQSLELTQWDCHSDVIASLRSPYTTLSFSA
ncbi:hypothetical protein NW752_002535 [Fusarium irregulare]|nr:hypothetical protein NW752_002535 [Fusarium irregulare]